MSNQETEDVFWRLGIMDCNTKMGNETAGYCWINFGIVTFNNILVIMNIGLQHLWAIFLGLKYLYKQQNNIILPSGLYFEFPMGNDRWKLNWLHLTEHLSNGNSVQLNTKIETGTKFATLLLNDRKNWTLSQYWKLNFITNEYTNFPLSLQWGMSGENSINFV